MPVSIVLLSWQGHCRSSLSSFNECRLSAKRLPTIRLSQLTRAVSPPVSCYLLNHRRHLILLFGPKADTHFTIPTKGRTLSQPRWLATYRDDLPARRWLPIQVLTGRKVEQLHWLRPMRYHWASLAMPPSNALLLWICFSNPSVRLWALLLWPVGTFIADKH